MSPMGLGSVVDPEEDLLVVWSQNLSPNVICCLGETNYKHLVLVTTVDPNEHTLNKKKAEFLERVKENGGLFLTYPQ